MALTASAVILFNNQKKILLVRNNKEPYITWSLPGGKGEPGETCEQAAIRETYEETGIEVSIVHKILGINKITTTTKIPYYIEYFLVKAVHQEYILMQPNNEIAELKWFDVHELKEEDMRYKGILSLIKEVV